jgi:hypothetical protein
MARLCGIHAALATDVRQAVAVTIFLVLFVYRRKKNMRSDLGDLAPWSFEKRALLGTGACQFSA